MHLKKYKKNEDTIDEKGGKGLDGIMKRRAQSHKIMKRWTIQKFDVARLLFWCIAFMVH